MALKANKKPNSDEPEPGQSRTFSPFDHPDKYIGESCAKLELLKRKKPKSSKGYSSLGGKEKPFSVPENPPQELELTRERVRVREWKKGRKVQIQAVGGEEEDLAKQHRREEELWCAAAHISFFKVVHILICLLRG
ncbi:unnamed protein product [Sphenostylis stenocarpa]|uniref:Uncharacterized protein n=1 Tax=Sphenostylis stenocarpa TaxID=92480 RepID=A0AA86SB63_9FABA|nr:unnamed protein product [Sphenostylis stenocarpa]